MLLTAGFRIIRVCICGCGGAVWVKLEELGAGAC